jgi:hypothetical protein
MRRRSALDEGLDRRPRRPTERGFAAARRYQQPRHAGTVPEPRGFNLTEISMDRLQRVMLANGFLVILVSMLAGFMLMFSLLGGLEVWPGTIVAIPVYGTGEGWVRAHSGGAMNGLLVIVIALALPKLSLSPMLQRLTDLSTLPGRLRCSTGSAMPPPTVR